MYETINKIRQVEKRRRLVWDEDESDLVRDSSSEGSNPEKKEEEEEEEEEDNNGEEGEEQQKGTKKPARKLSISSPELGIISKQLEELALFPPRNMRAIEDDWKKAAFFRK